MDVDPQGITNMRGIMIGCAISTVLWAIIIAAIVFVI